MNRSLSPLAFLLCLSTWTQAQETATLFADPAAQIKAVDGDPKRKLLIFESKPDKALKLSPGSHVLDVCFQRSAANSAGPYVTTEIVYCIDDRKITIDAQAGRVYRLKIALLPVEWKAWIVDVTDEEAQLLAQPPKPKTKGGGKSLILMRVTPANLRVSIGSGRIEHIWFMPGMFGTFLLAGDGADGFVSRKASSGSTVAILDFNTPKDSLIPRKTEFICGETKVPVIEDVPGDTALYLGEFDFTTTADGPHIRVQHDGLEAAREYLRKTDAGLADRLQPATLQWKRLPVMCAVSASENLRIDPGP